MVQVPRAPEKAWDSKHKTIQNSEQFKTQPLCRKQRQRGDRMPTVCFQVLHENHRLALLNYYEREIKSPPGITSYLSESKSAKVNKEYLLGRARRRGNVPSPFLPRSIAKSHNGEQEEVPFKNTSTPTNKAAITLLGLYVEK